MIDIREHGGLFGGGNDVYFPKWHFKKGDRWVVGEDAPFTSAQGSTVSVNKKIYIFCAGIGGSYKTGAYVFDTEKYTFQSIAPSLSERDQTSAVLYQSRYAFVIGGRYSNNPLTTVERYDILTNTWESMAPMPKGQQYPAVCLVGDYIYVMGGGQDTNHFLRYNILTNTWTTLVDLPFTTYRGAAYLHDSKIYLFERSLVQCYDINTETWSSKTAPPSMIGYTRTSGIINGKVYIFDNTKTSCYDILTDTWTTKRTRHITTIDEWSVGQTSKHIYSIGGVTASVNRYNDVEVYFV